MGRGCRQHALPDGEECRTHGRPGAQSEAEVGLRRSDGIIAVQSADNRIGPDVRRHRHRLRVFAGCQDGVRLLGLSDQRQFEARSAWERSGQRLDQIRRLLRDFRTSSTAWMRRPASSFGPLARTIISSRASPRLPSSMTGKCSAGIVVGRISGGELDFPVARREAAWSHSMPAMASAFWKTYVMDEPKPFARIPRACSCAARGSVWNSRRSIPSSTRSISHGRRGNRAGRENQRCRDGAGLKPARSCGTTRSRKTTHFSAAAAAAPTSPITSPESRTGSGYRQFADPEDAAGWQASGAHGRQGRPRVRAGSG